jgi:hypothetical protein
MDEPYVRCVGKLDDNGNPTIEYSDGSVRVFRDSPFKGEREEKVDCKNCGNTIRDLSTLLQSNGFCKPCYPQVHFSVPYEIKSNTEGWGNWRWTSQVKYTTDGHNSSHLVRRSGADFFSNNFGVGDTVLFEPQRKTPPKHAEGTVIDLHRYSLSEYNSDDYKIYLAKIFLHATKTLVAQEASQLEALTCNHVPLDTSEFDGRLDDVPCTFEPQKAGLGEIFADDRARAFWMTYRLNHISDDNALVLLKKKAIEISRELKKAEFPRDRVHLWLKKALRTTCLQMEDDQIAALVPYLVGARKSGYHVVEKRIAV